MSSTESHFLPRRALLCTLVALGTLPLTRSAPNTQGSSVNKVVAKFRAAYEACEASDKSLWALRDEQGKDAVKRVLRNRVGHKLIGEAFGYSWTPSDSIKLGLMAVGVQHILYHLLAHDHSVLVLNALNAGVYALWKAATKSEGVWDDFGEVGKRAHSLVLTALVNHFICVPGLRQYLDKPLTMVLPAFSHKDEPHLAANMAVLNVYGPFIARTIGHQRFASLFATCTVGSSLCEVLFPGQVGLGASGVISALISYAALRSPDAKLGLNIGGMKNPPLLTAGLSIIGADVAGLLTQSDEIRVGDLVTVVEKKSDIYYKVTEELRASPFKRYKIEDSDSGETLVLGKRKIQKIKIGHGAHLAGALAGIMFFFGEAFIIPFCRRTFARIASWWRRVVSESSGR